MSPVPTTEEPSPTVRADVAAELQKLAHQLGIAGERLSALRGVPAADLRELRRRIGDVLFEANRHQFTTMATLSKAVPAPIAARVSEAVLPPLLAARTAELFDPRRAADMVARMSDGYLADVAAAMDPSRSPHVIAALPADRVALVGRELARRGEWVVMGAFVSFVSPDALRAAVEALDGEQMLRVGFVLDDTSRLAEIGTLMSDAQRDRLLAAATSRALWAELDALVAAQDDTTVASLARRFAVAPAPVRAAVTDAHASGLLSEQCVRRLSR